MGLVVLRGVSGRRWDAARRAACEADAVGSVRAAIQDRIAKRGVADVVVPVFNRELAGRQPGAAGGPISDNFEQIAAFAVAERCQAPVVQATGQLHRRTRRVRR